VREQQVTTRPRLAQSAFRAQQAHENWTDGKLPCPSLVGQGESLVGVGEDDAIGAF
jgi:hypothetical protein